MNVKQEIEKIMNQTAVEWLFEQLWETSKDKFTWHSILEQAKEMEKQQVINAFGVGCQVESTRLIGYQDLAEQYYNETYEMKHMKGRLWKVNDQWLVSYNDSTGIFRTLPLNPYNVQTINDQEKVFDDMEARISAYPDVEFEIELFWETGIEEPFYVATLIKESIY